jgi:hypothetical protein
VSHGRAVIVWGERWPAKAISFLEPEGRWETGHLVVLEDVPEPEGLSGDEPSCLVCVDCLLDEHPELGRGFDLARVHGQVVWDGDGGGWVLRD